MFLCFARKLEDKVGESDFNREVIRTYQSLQSEATRFAYKSKTYNASSRSEIVEMTLKKSFSEISLAPKTARQRHLRQNDERLRGEKQWID